MCGILIWLCNNGTNIVKLQNNLVGGDFLGSFKKSLGKNHQNARSFADETAAFEAVSRTTIRPINQQSLIDFRTANLPSERPFSDGFDPRNYRDPQNPIKLWMAYFNLLRTVFGAGVLGLPMAISQSGIILGPIMAVLTGLLITHTHFMLLGSLNEISRRLKIPYISYRYGFRLAMLHGPTFLHCVGHHAPCIIATFMFLSQVGICTVFVLFTTDSLRDIMDWQSNYEAILALLLPYLLLEFFMKTLNIVSYVSMFGNLLNLIGLALVLYHIFQEPRGEVVSWNTEALSLLFAFGTYLFNLSAVGVVLSIDKALVDPKIMTERFGVVTVGIMVPAVVSTIFGVLGYWSFGAMEENILRVLPFDDDVTMAALGLYLIAVALSYPLQCYPGIQMVIEVMRSRDLDETPSESELRIIETFARPVFVLTTFLISYLVPFQGPFVAFVGNLCTSLLALVFPALMELSLRYPNDYGKYNVYLIKNLVIIAMGLVSWLFGVVLCGYLIYMRILSARSPNHGYYF